MPTYVYRREDGSTFEITQRITDDPLPEDPETGQRVERVITGAGLVFKGSGFYLTDYARKNGSTAKPESKPDGGEKKADAAAAKPDAPKADAAPAKKD